MLTVLLSAVEISSSTDFIFVLTGVRGARWPPGSASLFGPLGA
jgi:hypothetical protein